MTIKPALTVVHLKTRFFSSTGVIKVVDDVSFYPNHPYTQALLAEAPTPAVKKKGFVAIRGEIPSPPHPPPGCHFHPRCPHATARCKIEKPDQAEIAPGHFPACHLNGG